MAGLAQHARQSRPSDRPDGGISTRLSRKRRVIGLIIIAIVLDAIDLYRLLFEQIRIVEVRGHTGCLGICG
jgi:hypothetical protein